MIFATREIRSGGGRGEPPADGDRTASPEFDTIENVRMRFLLMSRPLGTLVGPAVKLPVKARNAGRLGLLPGGVRAGP